MATTYGTADKEEPLMGGGGGEGGGGEEPVATDHHRMYYLVIVRLLDGVKVATFHEFKCPETVSKKVNDSMISRARAVVGKKVIARLVKMDNSEPTRTSLLDEAGNQRITFITDALCAYIAVTTTDYPQATIFAGLSALRGQLDAIRGSREVNVELCTAKALNPPLQRAFRDLRTKYSDAHESSAITRAKDTMAKVVVKMQDNIDKAITVVAETETLMTDAQALQAETEDTKVVAEDWRQQKACCCAMFAGCCGRSRQCFSKFFMGVVSLFFVLLGLGMVGLGAYTIAVLNFGGENILRGYTSATIVTLLVVGLVLAFVSCAVFCSTLKPTECCSKFILLIFSGVLLAVFLAQIAVVVLAYAWVGDLSITIEGVDTDELFNETVAQLYDDCCNPNATTAVHDVCDHILGAHAAADCSSFEAFAEAVADVLKPLLKYAAVFCVVAAVLEIIAFICSCCLLGTAKKAKARSFDQ